MKKYIWIVVGLAIGIVMGLIGGPVWIILPWGAIAIALGYESRNHRLVSSAAFGFTATFVFMLKGYDGTATLISRVPPFLLIALFGGVCGLIAGWVGQRLSQRKH